MKQAENSIVTQMSKLGFDFEYDPESKILKLDRFKDCKCCEGFINMCKGEACKELGFCNCVFLEMHKSQWAESELIN